MLGTEKGLQTPRLLSVWNGGQGRKGGKEKTSEAVGGEVENVILGDGRICTIGDVPGSSKVKHTAAQRTEGQLGASGKKEVLGVQGRSWIGRRLENEGVRGQALDNPTRMTDN